MPASLLSSDRLCPVPSRRFGQNRNFNVAYQHVRQRILRGQYAPGQPLPVSRLAIETGVSSIPIREALRHLATEGLVTIEARLGARVRRMDLREFRDLGQMRVALESQAASLAAVQRTAGDLAELRTWLAASRHEAAGPDPEISEPGAETGEPWRACIRFHLTILAAARNPLLRQEILRWHLVNRVAAAGLAGRFDPVGFQPDPVGRREVLAGHEEIFAAIAAQDAEGAHDAMGRHLRRGLERQIGRILRASADGLAAGAEENLACGYSPVL